MKKPPGTMFPGGLCTFLRGCDGTKAYVAVYMHPLVRNAAGYGWSDSTNAAMSSDACGL